MVSFPSHQGILFNTTLEGLPKRELDPSVPYVSVATPQGVMGTGLLSGVGDAGAWNPSCCVFGVVCSGCWVSFDSNTDIF